MKTPLTDLEYAILREPMVDTHEHQGRDAAFQAFPPDILFDLFLNYIEHDLPVAGASGDAARALMDTANPDIAARFEGIRDAWLASAFNGYGEAVRLIARLAFQMDDVTAEQLLAAKDKPREYRGPGSRIRIFRDLARLDHLQIDYQQFDNPPDEEDPHFYLYDLTMRPFANGEFDIQHIHQESGVEVTSPATLVEAIEALFDKHAPTCIAVKTQHAYDRSLAWARRDPGEVAPLIEKKRAGTPLTAAQKDILGDFALDHVARLCAEHARPLKIHTGYLARCNCMHLDHLRAGQMCGLFLEHPATRFELFHIAYPYEAETIALAKHFTNVWVDMCWAWSINPRASATFVREFIHAAPSNKLFVFGGDSWHPLATWAYGEQCRRGLLAALRAEVADGDLAEAQAIGLARRFMRENQLAFFPLDEVRSNIDARLKAQRSSH